MTDKILGYLMKAWDWVKGSVPWLIVIGVWQYFTRKVWKAERTIEQKELEIVHHENKKEVEKRHAGRSDSDIVMDAIREGRDIRIKNGEEFPGKNNGSDES